MGKRRKKPDQMPIPPAKDVPDSEESEDQPVHEDAGSSPVERFWQRHEIDPERGAGPIEQFRRNQTQEQTPVPGLAEAVLGGGAGSGGLNEVIELLRSIDDRLEQMQLDAIEKEGGGLT